MKSVQKITSKDTSINTLNKVYKDIRGMYPSGTVILDYGCGRYDTNKNYAERSGYTWFGIDPYNKEETHNRRVWKAMQKTPPKVIICSNVLNVIAEDEVVLDVVRQIAEIASDDTDVYFTIYEKNGSGIGEVTHKGYQRNMKTKAYLPYVAEYFVFYDLKGNIIKCRTMRKAA